MLTSDSTAPALLIYTEYNINQLLLQSFSGVWII